MSINSKESLPCPKCGHLNDITVWNSITADSNPDLKQDLLSGKINFFVCSSCGYRALMPNPMLYYDDSHKLIISFSPCNDDVTTQKLYDEVRKAAEESGELKKLDGYNLRFVTNINDLMEKIITFDYNLNDKVIEVMKIMILARDPDTAPYRECRFGKLENDNIEFVIRDTKLKQLFTCNTPIDTYNKLYKDIMDSGIKPYSFNWELVDNFYASRILNGFNNIQ